MTAYLRLDVVNARRRSDRDFDVDIDFIAPGQEGATGWLPLVVLHEEWLKRPEEIGGLAVAAGARSADDCAREWGYVLDLDDDGKFFSMCHGVWALVCARSET